MPPFTEDPSSRASQDAIDLSQHGKSNQHHSEFLSAVPEGYQKGRTRYVAVLGTVMSGLGKGIFSSSLAKLLKDKGLAVAPIKLEGYLNIDSGTLNPYRHGEVFVLDDGTETDMDLGTYERMLDQNLSRQNFATSGQIFSTILERERRGGYLGRDVQMIPHVTGEVKHRLRRLAMTGGEDGGPADVVFVEVGGTVGDYENGFYIEALRELAYEEGSSSVCFVGLTYVIEPEILGEQKSKAAQLGIKLLMQAGIQPHLIACRCENPVTTSAMEKISMFSNVPMHRVFSMHDRESIYVIPDALRAEGLDREVLSILDLHGRVDVAAEDTARQSWSRYAEAIVAPREESIRVGILGKYASLRDAYASIEKSIEHASTHLAVRPELEWVDVSEHEPDSIGSVLSELDLNAIIVPGGFGDRGVEAKIETVRFARESRVPFLGICLGFQMAVIEFARHRAGLKDAHSLEFSEHGTPVISELPEQKAIEGLGGTMRLGGQDVKLTSGTLAHWLFGQNAVRERFRHRYEVEPDHIERFESQGLIFSGRHPDRPIMQMLELPLDQHPFFFAAQSHPELTSRPLSPQPMFMGLLSAAIRHAYPTLTLQGARSRWLAAESTAGIPGSTTQPLH